MSNRLNLHLFGSPRFTWQDEPLLGFISNKARALLVYLASTQRFHSRNALAELLWADTPTTARANLRRTLGNLRTLNGINFCMDSAQWLAFDPDNCWVDVVEFERLVSIPVAVDEIDPLVHAAQLYHDDFLAGFNLSVSYEFEAWALRERARLKGQMVEVLQRLAEQYEQRNELSAAIETIRHLLHLEPWREEAHRRLMVLLARHDEVSAALMHFETCCAQLRTELDVEPSPATLELVEQIRTGAFTPTKPLQVTSSPRVTQPGAHQSMVTTIEFPLVGRDQEWQTVRTVWQGLGQPHFFCIGGEAGIGKTRLAEELLLFAERDGAAVARTRSHALQGQLAYAPIADWLQATPLQAPLSQLEEVWLTEIARLQPELLSYRPDLPPPQPLRESWQRKHFFDALCHVFASVRGPLLLLLDDLQWSDGETLEWLQYLVERAESRLLVLGTVRTDELGAEHPLHHLRQQLQRHDRFSELLLTPLDQDTTTELAAQVREEVLARELAERLFHDTAGNPLFIIERMRATSAQDDVVSLPPHPDHVGGDEPLTMPPKMYSVICARLGQLSSKAQTLAQLGATIGRAFDPPLLAKAAACDEEAVLLALDELWQHRVIREIDARRFDFSHDRIRDVAYGEISPVRRRLLHRQVAHALETIYGDNLDAACGHLAVHCEAAGLLEQAIVYYQRAADGARQLFAHQEAVAHRQRALHLLRQLPRSTENRQTEIDLLLALAEARIEAEGKGHPTVGSDLLPAHTLAQEIGTPVQQVNVLNALVIYNRVRGEWIYSYERAIKSLAMAAKVGDPVLLTYARYSIACVLMRRGDLEEAQAYFEQVQPYTSLKDSAGGNIGFFARSAYCLWLLGFPEQALRRFDAGMQWARENGPSSLQIVLHQYSSILLFCRDVSTVDTLSAELVELSTERDDEFSLRWGNIYRGWLLVQQGDLHDGIALIRENADTHRARGNYFYECFWRALLAEAYLLASDLAAALREIEQTLAYAQECGDHHLDAQLLKLKGDYLQAKNAPDAEIEQCYQLAIDTARSQKARSLELRATTSLCRLWQRQGKTTAAHHLLTGLYGWFSEGFETGDLIEARALLAELRLDSVH